MKINYKMHSGQVTADAHSRIFYAHDAYAVETYFENDVTHLIANLEFKDVKSPFQKKLIRDSEKNCELKQAVCNCRQDKQRL